MAYASFVEALDHALALQAAVGTLHVTIVPSEANGFGWYLSGPDGVLLTCCRWYPVAALALASAKAAQSGLAVAEITEVPQRMTASGRRTVRASTRYAGQEAW